jgi:hypothetical protein
MINGLMSFKKEINIVSRNINVCGWYLYICLSIGEDKYVFEYNWFCGC